MTLERSTVSRDNVVSKSLRDAPMKLPCTEMALKLAMQGGTRQVRNGRWRADKQYALNHKTVAKWHKRAFVHDAAMGTKTPRSKA